MEAAIDPYDRLAFRGQRARLVVGQSFRARQAPGDVLVPIERAEILGRGDNRHPLRPTLFRPADVDERHAVGLRVQLLPVRFNLRVVREEVIVADVGAKLLFGRGDDRRDRRLGTAHREPETTSTTASAAARALRFTMATPMIVRLRWA